MIQQIMCFGDSNTFGVDPRTGNRLAYTDRWTGILNEELGQEYLIIEEGLGGRTTVWEDPLAPGRNGVKALPMLLDTHSPLQMVILMAGTNDLKERFGLLAEDIASGMERLICTIKYHKYADYAQVPRIMVIVPPILGEQVENSRYTGYTFRAVEKSRKLSKLYQKLCTQYDCRYLDSNEFVSVDEHDQIHLNVQSHKILAEQIKKAILEETGR